MEQLNLDTIDWARVPTGTRVHRDSDHWSKPSADLIIGPSEGATTFTVLTTMTKMVEHRYPILTDTGRYDTISLPCNYITRLELLTPEEIEEFKAKAQVRRAEIEQEKAKAEEDKAKARQEAYNAGLALGLTPFSESKRGSSCHALASRNLRTHLSKVFPGIKFEVRCRGSNSINVDWDNGPTREEVKEVTRLYQTYDFDPMQDISRPMGQAWPQYFGGAHYVFEYRNTTKLLYAIEREICRIENREVDSTVNRIAQELIDKTSFQANESFASLEDGFPNGYQLIKKVADPIPHNGGAVSMRLNDLKGGVEIRFSAKPSPETLAHLKASGFRWSKPQRLWYARQNEKTIRIAEAVAGIA